MRDRLDALTDMLRHVGARFMLARYLLASICALSVDMILFMALSHAGVPPIVTAFCAYAAGLAVHWTISVRFVFDVQGGATHVQRAGFLVSALIGMGITLALVGGLSAVGAAPILAKLLSVPVSFFTVYLVRKHVVFGIG